MTTSTITRPNVEKARDALHVAERHLMNARRDVVQTEEHLVSVLELLDDKPQAVSTDDLVSARTEVERSELIVAAAERGVEQAQADLQAAQLADLEGRAAELIDSQADDAEVAQARDDLRAAQRRYEQLTTERDEALWDLAREFLDAGAPRVRAGEHRVGWIGAHRTTHPFGVNLSDGRSLVKNRR